MIWACFSSNGFSSVTFVEGIQNAVKYYKTLGEGLMPFLNKNYGKGRVFM